MKNCAYVISQIVVAGLLGLSLLSCSGDGAGTQIAGAQRAEAAGLTQGDGGADGAQAGREPVSYTNGKARALLDKCSAHTITPEDCRDAMEMLQGAMADVQQSMSEIVDKATSQVEVTENIGDKEREFRDKYRYANQLREMLQTLPDSCMGPALHQQFQAWNKEMEDGFRSLDARVREKFDLNNGGNTAD